MGDDLMDMLSQPSDPDENDAADQGHKDLLGSLMGGAAPGNQSAAQEDDAGLGGLLGGLMGGGSAGGLGGLLGGLMGGGSPSTFGGGGGPMLPFAETLAEKLHISPQMANTLIMGAIGLLTASAAKKKQSGRSVDLAGITSPDYIRSSGVASRLSVQMGISEDDAVAGLQEAMGLMAAQSGMDTAPKPAAKKRTAKKTGDDAPPAAKKSTRKATKTTPKKSSTSETGPDFMSLLDDPR